MITYVIDGSKGAMVPLGANLISYIYYKFSFLNIQSCTKHIILIFLCSILKWPHLDHCPNSPMNPTIEKKHSYQIFISEIFNTPIISTPQIAYDTKIISA